MFYLPEIWNRVLLEGQAFAAVVPSCAETFSVDQRSVRRLEVQRHPRLQMCLLTRKTTFEPRKSDIKQQFLGSS